MAPVFVIPTSLRDLEAPAENGERLYAQEIVEVENVSASEVNDLVKGTRWQYMFTLYSTRELFLWQAKFLQEPQV